MREEEKNKQSFSLAMENIGYQKDLRSDIESDFQNIKSAIINDDLKSLIHLLENENVDTLIKCLLEASKIGTEGSVSRIIDQLKVTSKDFDIYNITGSGGNTVLHVAAESRSTNATKIMDRLLAEDIRLLEKENEERRTPLHSAAYGHIMLVQQLWN